MLSPLLRFPKKPFLMRILLGLFLGFSILSVSFFYNPRMTNPNILYYYFYTNNKPITPFSLDLFKAERYHAAVVIRQLIGNLVYYSNLGRYEPGIAESWQRENPNKWVFNLKSGFTCENGEIIDALSFQNSLKKSISILSRKNNNYLPIFSKLEGYSEFLQDPNDISQKNIKGLQVNNNSISFNFTEPIRTGLVEILSFTSFGYICADNLNVRGEWADELKFISSGPYRIKDFFSGQFYLLEKNPTWPKKNHKAPEQVVINLSLPNTNLPDSYPTIIDTYTPMTNIPIGLSQFNLIPEYANLILLGQLQNGFFSKRNHRTMLHAAIEKNRQQMPNSWQGHIQSDLLFYSQKKENNFANAKSIYNKPAHPKYNLRIEGSEPVLNSTRWITWVILKKALADLHWNYIFANQDEKYWNKGINATFDIKMSAPSIGGAFEPSNIEINFCSPIGIKLPDPSGTICKLLDKYKNENLSPSVLENQFYEVVKREAAIIPISHFGITWYLQGLDMNSISPLISVVRFDNLRMD